MIANLEDSTIRNVASCDTSVLSMNSPMKKSLLKEPTNFSSGIKKQNSLAQPLNTSTTARHVLLDLDKSLNTRVK